jgi:hypothetical protein
MKIVVALWNFPRDNSLTVKAVPTLTNWRNSMKAIVKAALNIDALRRDFENICVDDCKEISDYTNDEIVGEAEYVLSTYFEGGHSNNDALNGEYGSDEERVAKQDVRRLKALIKKYKTADTQYSRYIKHLNLI